MTRTEVIYPRRSATTHTESLGDEASVYDWAQKQVHAFNPTAATVWRLCDGATSTDAIAEVLHREMGIPEAHAVVDLTLKKLARLHLLDLPVESLRERSAPSRRWLLGRGLATAMLPAVYTDPDAVTAPSAIGCSSGEHRAAIRFRRHHGGRVPNRHRFRQRQHGSEHRRWRCDGRPRHLHGRRACGYLPSRSMQAQHWVYGRCQ